MKTTSILIDVIIMVIILSEKSSVDSNSKTKSLKLFILCAILLLGSFNLVMQAYAWSNGGYSNDPQYPKYGTHDWIAQHALDWLPTNEKEYVTNNISLYLYGTELPDGIGDTAKHHIYFFSNGTLQDDSAAVRAQEEYDEVLAYLRANNFIMAAKAAGIMSHYIADVGVFGHVMGNKTDLGPETHHNDYENYVETKTNNYTAEFNIYLSFDGSLDNITAYEAAKTLAYDTTFDGNMNLTCVWMDSNYNWTNPTFRNRCGESLNLAVNLLTDVLHTLYISRSNCTGIPNYVVINEFEQNPPGADAGNEWVELYNPTASSIHIGGWKLESTHGTIESYNISSGSVISPDGYWTVTFPKQWLDNEDESVVLFNSIGQEIDRTPTVTDTKDNNWCWARYPNGYDTNSSSDWRFQNATKGFSNGKWLSSISCYVNPAGIAIGSSTVVQGTISPICINVVVHIWYSEIEGNLTWLAEVLTNSSGGYQYEWTPSIAGNYSIKTGWDGDIYYIGSNSTVQTLTVWGDIQGFFYVRDEVEPDADWIKVTKNQNETIWLQSNYIDFKFEPTACSSDVADVKIRVQRQNSTTFNEYHLTKDLTDGNWYIYDVSFDEGTYEITGWVKPNYRDNWLQLA